MKTLLLSFLFCVFVFTVHSQEKERVEIMMKMMGLRSGLLNRDSVSLSVLLADDLTYGHSNGIVQTKKELIHDLITRAQDYKTIDPSEMKIRFFGNTSVVNMDSHVILMYQGSSLDMKMHVVLVWIKQDGLWKLVARQSVKM